MRTSWLTAVLLLASSMSGNAASPPALAGDLALPPLEDGWSRVYLSTGQMGAVKFPKSQQGGPIYVSNQLIGTGGKNEYFVVDILPGNYEAYCAMNDPYKNLMDKRQFTFNAGETRYLACDLEFPNRGSALMGMVGGGVLGGAIVAGLAGSSTGARSSYSTVTHFADEPLNPKSKFVGYKKLADDAAVASQARVE